MKKIVSFLLGGMLLLSLSACGSNSEHVSDNTDSAQTEPTIESISETQTPESEEINSEPKENHADERQIRVNGKDGQNIVFRLNDSTAANTLYEQLPLSHIPVPIMAGRSVRSCFPIPLTPGFPLLPSQTRLLHQTFLFWYIPL